MPVRHAGYLRGPWRTALTYAFAADTRWLSLVQRQRDPGPAVSKGNLYIAARQTAVAAGRCSSTTWAWSVRRCARGEGGYAGRRHEHAAGRSPKSRFNSTAHATDPPAEVLAQRAARHGWTTPGYPQEVRTTNPERGQEAPSSGMLPSLGNRSRGRKPAPDGSSVPEAGKYRYVMIIINEVRTVPRGPCRACGCQTASSVLSFEQQSGALVALHGRWTKPAAGGTGRMGGALLLARCTSGCTCSGASSKAIH